MIRATNLKNLFENYNARTQSVDDIVKTFVPNQSFWRLLSPKNHIVLGTRGSGKTAVIRMLAHDHLSQLDNARARDIVESKLLIGTYVPMRAEWVSTLQNKPWMNDAQHERLFCWRLNLSSCRAFLETAASCFLAYVPDEIARLRAERNWCRAVASSWSNGSFTANSKREIQSYLEDVEWERNVALAKVGFGLAGLPEDFNGVAFGAELFAPLARAIELLQRELEFKSNTKWMVCLDEIEFLDRNHHRILNSHLRSSAGNLCFKMTTMPYFHHTLETNNQAPLVHEDDFDYVYLDFDPAIRGTDRDGWVSWAEEILGKRLGYVSADDPFSLEKVLGKETPLLDDKKVDWGPDSPMMGLLRKYGSRSVRVRANDLAGTPEFKDQISRKLHGMLLLREKISNLGGRREHSLYSGPKMLVRCSDANPRQLIRMFNELNLADPLPAEEKKQRKFSHPKATRQTRLLIDYSNEALSYLASEEEVGFELAKFIRDLCEYFKHRFYDEPLGTDYYYAIKIDERVDDQTWLFIKYAVALGMLFPKVNFNRPEQLPIRDGEFDLSFRLAPAFSLLPRKGKPISLSVIQKWISGGKKLTVSSATALVQPTLPFDHDR